MKRLLSLVALFAVLIIPANIFCCRNYVENRFIDKYGPEVL